MTDATLKTEMVKFIEQKSANPFEYKDYFFVAQSWVQKDRDTKQPVLKDGKEVWNKFVYRFNPDEKDKAVEKAKPYEPKSSGSGGARFAPKKPNIITFRDPNKVRVNDEETKKGLENNGYHILPYSLTGRPAIFDDYVDDKQVEFAWYGQIYNIDL